MIVTTLEKVFANLKNNFKNPKYYRIRSDSNTFNTYLNNPFCLRVLETFGFETEANSKDLIFPINTLDTIILKNYKIFNDAVKSVVRNG